jgi:hypothetical protein
LQTGSSAVSFAGANVVVCLKCKHPNPRENNFCTACTAQLWEACIGCGLRNAASAVACGRCGVKIADAVAAAVKDCEMHKKQAQALAAQNDLPGALMTAGQIADKAHPRLKEFRDWANALVAELTPKMREQEKHRDHQLAVAQKLVAQHNFSQAMTALNLISPGVATPAVTTLRGQVEPALRQVNELRIEIDTLSKMGAKPETVAGKLNEFLKLQPGHVQAKEQLQRLQEQMERTRLAEQQQMWNRLGEEPSIVEYEEYRRLFPNSPQAEEARVGLAWLYRAQLIADPTDTVTRTKYVEVREADPALKKQDDETAMYGILGTHSIIGALAGGVVGMVIGFCLQAAWAVGLVLLAVIGGAVVAAIAGLIAKWRRVSQLGPLPFFSYFWTPEMLEKKYLGVSVWQRK